MEIFGKTYRKVTVRLAADGFGSEYQAARNASAKRGRRIGRAVGKRLARRPTGRDQPRPGAAANGSGWAEGREGLHTAPLFLNRNGKAFTQNRLDSMWQRPRSRPVSMRRTNFTSTT